MNLISKASSFGKIYNQTGANSSLIMKRFLASLTVN